MIVESHNNMKEPRRFQSTRLLVTADDGKTPLVLVVEYSGGSRTWVRCFRAGDKDFNEQLRMNGFKHTVLVTDMKAGPNGLLVPGG